MNKPRILHIAPSNTSGVPGQLVLAERKLGFESRLVTLFRDKRDYFEDICLDLPFIRFAPVFWMKKRVSKPERLTITNKTPRPERIPPTWNPHSSAERILVGMRDFVWKPIIDSAIEKYGLDTFDVVQLDGGLGLFRNSSFVKKMAAAGRKIICCYTGSDLRTRGVIRAVDKLSSLNVTVEFDHLRLHPNIHHVLFPFDSSAFEPVKRHNKKIKIGHAPTNRQAKGSDVIIPVLKQLELEMGTEMVLIENLPYREALTLKGQCDIFVDQIGDLGYGINSLEALAMGIPAASCLAPGFAKFYPDHPFVVIDKNNIKEQLVRLLKDQDLRKLLGERGREWVAKRHSPEAAVRKIHKLAGIID